MTYEEKLHKVVSKLREERELTREGRKTQVSYDDKSFTKVRINEICKILLKLRDDQKCVSIVTAFQPMRSDTTKFEQCNNDDDDFEKVVEIIVEVDEVFDRWYEEYIIKRESSLTNQTYLNLLRILDTMLSIREVIQLHNSTTVQIPFLPQRIRFRELMLQDDVGMRDEYIQGRWDAVVHLHNGGKIKHFKHIDSMMHRWDDTIQVTINATSFYTYLDEVKQEFAKRLDSKEQKKQQASIKENPVTTEKTTPNIQTTNKTHFPWPEDYIWNGSEFCFGKVAKMSFTSVDRKHIFKTLTDKKGDWATIKELRGDKEDGYVRTTIKQIEDRLPSEVKKVLKIVSTQGDDTEDKPKMGAYRIKLLHT